MLNESKTIPIFEVTQRTALTKFGMYTIWGNYIYEISFAVKKFPEVAGYFEPEVIGNTDNLIEAKIIAEKHAMRINHEI